jgi:hypothetical protein
VKDNELFSKIDVFSKLVKARRDDTLQSLEQKSCLDKRKRDKVAGGRPKLSERSRCSSQGLHERAAATGGQEMRRLDSWKDELARDPWVAESLRAVGHGEEIAGGASRRRGDRGETTCCGKRFFAADALLTAQSRTSS